MRLLLRADVDGLGTKGEVVEVADGYGRNYLMPKGLALPATAGAEQQAADMKRARDAADSAARAEAEGVATSLVNTPVTLAHRAGEGGKLFGSVTAADVVEALAALGVEVDRKQVDLGEGIRELGTHSVLVKLHPVVEFPLTIEVVEA